MNIFSFFAGAGFLDLGFELQGHYNIVFVNEFHEAFNHIYRYARQYMGIAAPRYGHHVEDITEYIDGQHSDRLQRLLEWVEESKAEDLTGFIGGPPCPDFSVAGKNRGRDGENGKLSGTYAQLICTALPDFFLFENVKGLYRTARHRAFFEELKLKFRKSGYSLTEQLVNSLEFGAPQDRDRIILIGFRQDIAERLNINTENGSLIGFPWDKYKIYKLDDLYEYGDVLFTLSSETPEEVGIGSVYLGKEKVYLNSFCFGIHITNMEVAFPPYLSYYVSSTAFRKFIYPYAQGSTRFNLCKADFEKASIKLPTLENQKRILSILSHIDSKIETEIQMLNLYNSQKQYLLRQMFI